MKILLIELEYHPEVLKGLYEHLVPSTDVHVVSNDRILQQAKIDASLPNIHVKKKEESIISIFERNHLDDIEWNVVVFTTAQSKFRELSKLHFKSKKAVIVHNIHSFFDRIKIDVQLNPFLLWKDFSYVTRIVLFKAELFFKRKFINGIDYFLFPSGFMVEYAFQNYPNCQSKFVKSPLTWKSVIQRESVRGPTKPQITIVGTIDPRRRDYQSIVRLISFLKKQSMPNLTICFAGMPFGRKGRAVLKKLIKVQEEDPRIHLQYFESFVDEGKMEEIMKQTSFLISPLPQKTRHHIWKEYYGKTKITGSINDAIEYQKTILLPGFYQIDSTLEQLVQTYTDQNDLNEKVIHLILNKEGKTTIQNSALMEKYSQKSVKENLLGILGKL